MTPREIIESSETSEGAIARLSEAFYPGTPAGLAKRYREIPREIADLVRERETIKTTLTELLLKTGEVIEVDGQPPLRLVMEGRLNGRHEWVTKPVLRFDKWRRCRRCGTYAELRISGICGSCADDLRGEAAAEEAGA